MDTSKKRGKLSLEEEAIIVDGVESGLTIEEIAKKIDRTIKPVEKFINQRGLHKGGGSEEVEEQNRLRKTLHLRKYWGDLNKQFNNDELRYFESAWIDLMAQFREDVLFSEELQIKQLITIDILLSRSMKERKLQINEVEKLQDLLEKEYAVDITQRDGSTIAMLEQQLALVRSSISSYTSEYAKLLEKQQSLQKDLKSTRDQRIKRVEDSKSSWAGYLRAIEDEVLRLKEGDQAEIMKLAKDKAKADLYEYHIYADGKGDRPLLNAESVELDQGE